MVRTMTRYGLLCLMLWVGNLVAFTANVRPPEISAAQFFVQPSPFFAAAAPDAVPADVDREFGETESKSHHAQRMNRDLIVIAVLILTTMVIFRIVLLWKIAQDRKRLAKENILETKS